MKKVKITNPTTQNKNGTNGTHKNVTFSSNL